MIFNDTKRCKNCAYKGQFQDGSWGCIKTKEKIDLEQDFCSKTSYSGYKCDRCGRFIMKGARSFVIPKEEKEYSLLCGDCFMAHQ